MRRSDDLVVIAFLSLIGISVVVLVGALLA
jgi:hypothetical protein